jgi:carbonic anhydrase
MDARLDVLKALGLRLGDAHVIRNAGGVATQDALRSLVISSALLGTEAALVIGHTDCGMTKFSNAELRERLRQKGIDAGDFDFLPFSFVDSQVVESVKRLRDSRLLPSGFAVHGFVYEVKTGRLRLVA